MTDAELAAYWRRVAESQRRIALQWMGYAIATWVVGGILFYLHSR